MTYQEKIDILSGLVYDYDDYCDSCPDYFDYDEPNDLMMMCMILLGRLSTGGTWVYCDGSGLSPWCRGFSRYKLNWN